MPEPCFFCADPNTVICTFCNIFATCIQHVDIHRPDQECFLFRVEHREDRGNCMIAVRNIKPFEIILQDRPAVIGPFDNSELVCLECYKPMEKFYPCSICSLPLCSKDCENKPRHSIECKYFKNTKPNFTECERSTIYSSIAPIRMLEIQKENGYIWSLVNRLEDHLQERRRGEPWTFLQETVFPFMEKYCEQDYSVNDLERIIGIFRTNSVKWEDKVGLETRPVGHALCPVFSVLCHSCVNNTRYTIEDGLITVRACIPIQAGEEITTQYRGPNDGNILRRPDFKKNWLFDCSCIRCQDPTELGTHSSTLKCFKCREPTLYPRTSDLESEWECRSCGDIVTHSQALEITLRLESLLYGKLYSDPPPSWETFIDDLEKYLHPTHFICMKAKRLLLQIYGSRGGYTLDKMSKEQLERKIQLCNNYIEVFSVLEPGFRIWKGRILEEMLGPVTLLLYKSLEEKKIGKVEYFLKYKDIIKMVREAAKCRQFLERNNEVDNKMGDFYSSWVRPLNAIINS